MIEQIEGKWEREKLYFNATCYGKRREGLEKWVVKRQSERKGERERERESHGVHTKFSASYKCGGCCTSVQSSFARSRRQSEITCRALVYRLWQTDRLNDHTTSKAHDRFVNGRTLTFSTADTALAKLMPCLCLVRLCRATFEGNGFL